MQAAEILFRTGLTLQVSNAIKCIKMYYNPAYMHQMPCRVLYNAVLSFESQLALRRKRLLAVCFVLISRLGYSSNLKMEETFYPETSAEIR